MVDYMCLRSSVRNQLDYPVMCGPKGHGSSSVPQDSEKWLSNVFSRFPTSSSVTRSNPQATMP